jgi:hypothetical protein
LSKLYKEIQAKQRIKGAANQVRIFLVYKGLIVATTTPVNARKDYLAIATYKLGKLDVLASFFFFLLYTTTIPALCYFYFFMFWVIFGFNCK